MLKCNQGFTLVEVVCALWLLSGVCFLYLPAFFQRTAQIQMIKETSNQWRVFQQCVLLDYHQQTELLDLQLQQEEIHSFGATDSGYWIEFNQGGSLYVEIQDSSS